MEAADSTTNSSKVIVQCHDPHNLFDSVVSKLNPRLPLSNLHWKSPNRPLRSIDRLDVSFVRNDTKTEDAASNARRHQIPGLRKTSPFVKVYLARCDDRDIYKETCRKEVKQWLKSQGISQDGKAGGTKGQEGHDAFEYIILHVVLPNTSAAAAPKSTKYMSVEASESTDSVNSKTKWTGKSTSTVFDKLRADFASSSKAPFERVAQVRITDVNSKQQNALGPSEIEEQWQDFTEKLKRAILISFGARVSQYEDDIRDREAQRQLPGWNFCTFFILKEGLARGFESVGLVEDALIVYDELSVGVDALLQEQASQEDVDPTSALLPFSTDLKPVIRTALDDSDQGQDGFVMASTPDLQTLIDLDRAEFPFDVERKGYQQRILTNQVSALDFHIYMFTKELQLLFRQANINTASSNPKSAAVSLNSSHHDFNIVAEACEKATSFIPSAARALRRDLYAAWGGQEGLSDDDLRTQQVIIGDIVASWKWSAIMQMISDCQLLQSLRDVLLDTSLEGDSEGLNLTRTRSLNGQSEFPNQDLAHWAGELFVMARDILHDTFLENVQLPRGSTQGLRSQSLSRLSQSKESAIDVFKLLTTYAYQCFDVAGRDNASHSMLHSLAKLELDNGRLDTAVWWLEHVPELSDLQAQTATDRTLLKFYAECLKMQDRLTEYAKSLIALLLCTVDNPFVRALPRFDEQSQHLLNELLNISARIPDIERPLTGFFTMHSIAKTISHDIQHNSIVLALALSLRFNASIEVSDFELILKPTRGQDPTQIMLKSTGAVSINSSKQVVTLSSNTIAEGHFSLVKFVIRIGKLTFVHHFESKVSAEEASGPLSMVRPVPIMIYPHSNGFTVSVKPSRTTDLAERGRLLFETFSGSTDIERCELRIRPATAGFRLDILATSSLVDDTAEAYTIEHQKGFNALVLNDLTSSSERSFEIPYSTEILTSNVSLKIEAVCKTKDGVFSTFFQRSINISLPISINVQDIFQVRRLFSRFTASPSTSIPLKILKWSIVSNDAYDVKCGEVSDDQIDIFTKMPASWVVSAVSKGSSSRRLPIAVQYQSYDDIILRGIETKFRQDVRSSSLAFASELLLTHLLGQLAAMWTEQDLETAALLQEFEIYPYEELSWEDPLLALDPSDRKSAEIWLQSWHRQNPAIPLDPALARILEVKLSVEMPKPSLVVSTEISLDSPDRKHLAAGDPIAARLVIECVWRTPIEAEIQFEVTSHQDTWLIGGKKRGTVPFKTNKSTLEVVLIAQRAGHLILPGIDVRLMVSNEAGQADKIDLEVEHKSQAKSVLVIPNQYISTVALGGGDMVGRHWSVESRRRHETT